ncbi:SDR family oxidoreductase [Flavimaricola marinus]|uniref:2-keto-3-deoxy-L-fuconate dehydrogenase n=1 Tax=Flavimaricola marinus TaxID=1819565 RepID=A0A238LK26_9RHOB|nr:SDR family oxidoreductase [Flavimaricola marinus]SMY09744.1 2-keto-3-deoxy-L-fuconate dehydrogenase [Flavimaricola marinus]
MDLTNRLSGKVAVVTAAGQGIGRAIAERLVAEGAEVHASDINAALLEDLTSTVTAALDATDASAVDAYFAGFDRIDVLVHGVGYVHQGTIEECTLEDWRRSCSITLDSAFNVLGAAIPKMKDHGGSIVTIGSVASSIKGFPKRAAYGATKGGVIGLTKSVAADYLPFGIRCNSICPGTVDSPSLRGRIDDLADQMGSHDAAMKFFIDRQPARRFGTPDEIAGLCAFLASADGAFVTGQAINIDGGITI